MAQVFLSYAREDRDVARRLAQAIESRGWSVWWDRRIPAGKSFEDVIEQEIDAASCVVVLWTRTSVMSEWVRNEAAEGARRKILIPIRLDDVRLPLAFRHLQADDLLGWTDAELKNCLESIASMVEETAKQPAVELPPPPQAPHAGAPPTGPRPMARTPASTISRPMWIAIVAFAVSIVLIIVVAVMSSSRTPPTIGALQTETSKTALATGTTATSTAPAAATAPAREEPVKVFALPTDTAATRVRLVAASSEVVDIETTVGTITVEFFPHDAPEHVANSLRVARSGGFDGAPILKILVGGFSAGRNTGQEIPQEYNDIALVRGTLTGMLSSDRTKDIGEEFYVASRDARRLNRKLVTVFGHVIAGMGVIDAIMRMPVDNRGRLRNPVTIHRAVVRNRS